MQKAPSLHGFPGQVELVCGAGSEAVPRLAPPVDPPVRAMLVLDVREPVHGDLDRTKDGLEDLDHLEETA